MVGLPLSLLEFEIERATKVAREQSLYKVYQLEVKREEHFTCRCLAYVHIREKYKDILSTTPSLLHMINTKKFQMFG